VIIQKYKLDYDINKLNKELEEIWPVADFSKQEHWTTPNGTYYQNISEGTMPAHIKKAIEHSVGQPIKDYYFLWDWRRITHFLIKHTDARLVDKENVFGAVPEEVFVVSLENGFTLDIWNNEDHDIIEESVSYEPGEIIGFNNHNSHHSGAVHDTSIPRRTLNCFAETN
jgi:hypothetical protein